jgi:glycosyltransferase involved in cell wall biosynthesis
MNILFILPEYYPHPGGGLATYYLEIIPEIVRQGHQVKVIVGSGVVMGEQTYEVGQVSIEYLKPTLFKKYLDKYKKLSLFPELQKHLAAAWAMWEQANHGVSYDIVETTDWGLGFAPWIMNPEGPPVITTLHGSIGQIEYFEPRTGYEIHGDFVRMLELSCLRHIDLVFSYSSTNTRFWND